MKTRPDDAPNGTGRPPGILVLATGGTIAGRSTRSGSTVAYDSGRVDVEEILAAVPELSGTARIMALRIAAIGSEHMTEEIWLRLAAATNQAMTNPEIDGVVILHGTDTLEETAFFLDLTLAGNKPVVLTGAMRPAGTLSADGPMNLLCAVRLAASGMARERGVLVVMNDVIFAGREVIKTDSLNLAAFAATGGGPLGRMVDGRPLFYRPVPEPRSAPAFSVNNLSALPRVEIIYGHAGMGREMVDAAARIAQGLIHAGVGMGNVHNAVRGAYAEAMAKGILVVRSSRVVHGHVPLLEGGYSRDGFIAAGNLNPQKARILLQLALSQTAKRDAVQDCFNRFGNAAPEN